MPTDFNHISAAIQALHAGAVLAVRDATKQVADGYSGYVAIRTGFTKAATYTVTSDASTYAQAVGTAQGIDAFRAVLPELEPPASDLEGIAADAAASAIYLEHGTSRMAAQPAMTPAAEAVRARLPEIVAEHVNRALTAALG